MPGGVIAGHVHRSRLAWLSSQPEFADEDGVPTLRGADFAERSAALAAAAARLPAEARLRPATGEQYPVVRAFGDPPLLQVDRAFVPAFGIRPFGVHCTAYVRTAAGLQLWIGERAHDKPTYPGRWDNTVAGGQPIGLSLRDNLQKECAEEAAIPAAMAAAAVATSAITYVQATPAGLKPDTLFCFDLEVPASFTPRPMDGEVARFFLLPAREVAEVVRDSERFKPNCALVLIDFFLRHGLLDGELTAAAQGALAAGLRRPLF